MKHDPPHRKTATPEDAPNATTKHSSSSLRPARQRTAMAARAKLKLGEHIKVWVRAGGICVLCKAYLLDGPLTGLGVSLGELAHIVGQQQNAASPRGLNPLPRQERDNADNVLLACPTCHAEIDKQLVAGVLDVSRLMAMKARHERHIRHVTTLADTERTMVLRVIGQLRGRSVEVSNEHVTAAVTAAGRFPWFDLDRDRRGVEIDLRQLPGEIEAGDAYYATACQAIDEVLTHKVHEAVKAGAVRHISVFPFARLPLLIYLGTGLEDNFAVEVYQRHRGTQQWIWDLDAEEHHFTVTQTDGLGGAAEAVLLLNVSGSVDIAQLPAELAPLPRLVIAPDVTPSPDVLRARSSLDAFCKAVRDANALLDAHKNIARLHIVGALPPTAAVELGRLHDPHIHPALVIYDRADGGAYRHALEIA